ncbi:MAG: transporter substrate-binding domain-containing protein [Gammaproteobacteria bacterium]|nr:transporter substrate-binding domain-containing protein [Gammaproteobacteria bacterium]
MSSLRFAAVLLLTVLGFQQSALAVSSDEPDALERVLERGVLEVAVYSDFPPFSFRDDRGRIVGIDADIARAVAESLGVAAALRAVGADESMEDDLRNNVWKGHYLGGGVADMMLHVPYDPGFARENDRAVFIAPYSREQIVVAIRKQATSGHDPLELFTREKVGVELDTLTDFYLLTAYDGKIRNQVVHFRTIGEAVAALKKGELSGVAGPRSEIEHALGERSGDFATGPVRMPGLRSTGWDLGAAVKQGNDSLADAIDTSVKKLRDNGTLKEVYSRYGVSYQLPSRLTPIKADTDERQALRR